MALNSDAKTHQLLTATNARLDRLIQLLEALVAAQAEAQPR